MAIVPLFVSDLATLKSKLRLTGVPAGVDCEAMIEQAVMDVRLGFFRQLTQPRCAVLAGYTHTDTPATDTEILRALAESTEIKWVRLFLMRTLPMSFLDGAAVNQVWNQEAPFRAASHLDLATEKTALENEIEEAITLLAGTQTPGSEVTINVTDVGPACPPPFVGKSIFRHGHGDPWR